MLRVDKVKQAIRDYASALPFEAILTRASGRLGRSALAIQAAKAAPFGEKEILYVDCIRQKQTASRPLHRKVGTQAFRREAGMYLPLLSASPDSHGRRCASYHAITPLPD